MMNKNLKKIMVTGTALLMFAGIGTGVNNVNVNARHVHYHRVAKVDSKQMNKQSNKKKANNKRQKRSKRNVKRNNKKATNRKYSNKQHVINNHKRQAKRLAKRAINKKRRNYRHAKKNDRVLRSKFRRSNNQCLLKQSGFYDLRTYGPDIMSKYAPNNRKAVIPKNVNVKDTLWLKGHFLQKNPTVYQYKPAKHGWIQL